MRPATSVTAMLLILIALAHLLRFAFGLEVTVQGVTVPLWVSIFGTIVPAGLAVGIWREHRRAAA